MGEIKELIEKHSNIMIEIEKLEDEKSSIQDKILEGISDFTEDELFEVFSSLKGDSSLKFRVFKMIKGDD